jgi:hypothetical protein
LNRYMQEKWSWIDGSHEMRTRMLAMLSDGDLAFNPGGQNITLGALCREMGEIEYAYAQSLTTFTIDWTYRNTEAVLDASVERLKAWFESLDGDMKATVEGFSDEDLAKTIDRGGYSMPVETQLDVYIQANLIFLGKATIYLKAMDRPLPKDWKEWIG